MPEGSAEARILGVYCERGSDPAFWAEPLNAVTNAAFLVAAAVAFVRHGRDPVAAALAALIGVIGAGSFLFHTLATRPAMLADVIPIQIFIAGYFFLAMRRFFSLGAIAAAGATLAFMAAAAALPGLAPEAGPWRGLAGYLGGFFGLLGVGGGLLLRSDGDRWTGRALIGVAGLFAASLTFRTIDGAVCAVLPSGTHLVWHVLNAAVLYALVAIMARRGKSAAAP